MLLFAAAQIFMAYDLWYLADYNVWRLQLEGNWEFCSHNMWLLSSLQKLLSGLKTFLHRLIVYWLALFLCCCILFIPVILMLSDVAFSLVDMDFHVCFQLFRSCTCIFSQLFQQCKHSWLVYLIYIYTRCFYLPRSHGTSSFFEFLQWTTVCKKFWKVSLLFLWCFRLLIQEI